MIIGVPDAVISPWRTDRGRAWPEKTTRVVASAAATSVVSAAAASTARWALSRGSVNVPRESIRSASYRSGIPFGNSVQSQCGCRNWVTPRNREASGYDTATALAIGGRRRRARGDLVILEAGGAGHGDRAGQPSVDPHGDAASERDHVRPGDHPMEELGLLAQFLAPLAPQVN